MNAVILVVFFGLLGTAWVWSLVRLYRMDPADRAEALRHSHRQRFW